MERREKIFCGSELIAARAKVIKDLPLIGLKEFQPNNSWLEGKQIQKCLEERFDLLKQEHIERDASLSSAEWVPGVRKAKVTRQTGKIWETFGHYKDDTTWLLAEEALYLLETNDLELFYNEMRLSIERSYAVLLDPSNGCTLEEYRTYSYLLNNGFKVIRHSPDVTLTGYEKQIHLEQRVTTQKREVPEMTEHEGAAVAAEKIPNGLPPRHWLDSDDVTIIEEEGKEIIDVEEVSPKREGQKSDPGSPEILEIKPSEKKIDIIFIEDDDEDDNSVKEESSDDESSSEGSSDSEDDVVYIGSEPGKRASRGDFARADRFLALPKEEEGGDEVELLENETDADIYEGRKSMVAVDKRDLIAMERAEILLRFPSAEERSTVIRSPDSRLLPASIVPRFSEYRVNLSVRHGGGPKRRTTYFWRQYNYNGGGGGRAVNPAPPAPPPPPPPVQVDNGLIRKAQEMQAMALGLLQVASNLISNIQSPWSHRSNNGLLQAPPIQSPYDRRYFTGVYRSPGQVRVDFQRRYQPRGGGYYSPRRQFHQRRSLPWRGGGGGYHHHRRGFKRSLDTLPQNGSHQPSPAETKHEVILLDSDDEEDVKVVKAVFKGKEDDKDSLRDSLGSGQPKKLKMDSPQQPADPLKCELGEQVETEDNPPWKDEKREELDEKQPVESKLEASKDDSQVGKGPDAALNSESKNETGRQEDEEILIQSSSDEASGEESSREMEPSVVENQQVVEENLEPGPSTNVSNWEQYKKLHDTDFIEIEDGDSNKDSCLLRLEACDTMENMLSSLQIFGKIDDSGPSNRMFKISFDIFTPGSNFKKSMKMLPNFRVIVLGPDDEVPSQPELSQLQRQYQDEIPFLFAVLLEESLSFYLFSTVYLPVHVD